MSELSREEQNLIIDDPKRILSSQIFHANPDRRTLKNKIKFRAWMFFFKLAKKPCKIISAEIIHRAYEMSYINSKQMHQLMDILQRTFRSTK